MIDTNKVTWDLLRLKVSNDHLSVIFWFEDNGLTLSIQILHLWLFDFIKIAYQQFKKYKNILANTHK